jgi:TonB family protein
MTRPGQPGTTLTLALALLGLAGAARAQAPAAPLPVMDAASLPAGISERLRREAERPMYWIKVHGEADKADARKPAAPRVEAARADPAPRSVPAPVAPAARAAPVLATEAVAPSTAPPDVRAGRMPASPVAPTPPPTPLAAATSASTPELGVTDSAAPAAPVGDAGPSTLASVAPAAPVAPPQPAPAAAPAEPLELLSSAQPDFPQTLMRRLRRGELQVEVDVATDGSVSDARVLSSSHPRLEAAALTAIKTWQFKPPARSTSAVINFSFDLDS